MRMAACQPSSLGSTVDSAFGPDEHLWRPFGSLRMKKPIISDWPLMGQYTEACSRRVVRSKNLKIDTKQWTKYMDCLCGYLPATRTIICGTTMAFGGFIIPFIQRRIRRSVSERVSELARLRRPVNVGISTSTICENWRKERAPRARVQKLYASFWKDSDYPSLAP